MDGLNLTLPKTINFNKHVFHIYVIRPKERDRLAEHLKASNIDCAVHYPIPQHLQKCLEHLGYKEGDMPEAERAAKEVLAIPIFPEITKEEQDYIISTINDFL
jgi:dTDP-4-amino-4,6-dideoxygalactose transaminase